MTSPTLRVGSVPYLVGRPLDLGLSEAPGIEFSRYVPAELVTKLRNGELDVALVSSIELFRRPGYRYLSGIGVAGRGHVASVQVFLRKPIEEVRSLALDPASRTAATLVRVLLSERANGAPEFREVTAGVDPREVDADAWLRIGDPALREFLAEDAPAVFNPSEAWCRRTGLPFVFAAWIVRPGAPIEAHLEAFAAARQRGAEALDTLIDEAATAWNLPRAACAIYLREECEYEPGAEMQAALFAFRAAAARLDLCQADLAPAGIGLCTEYLAQ